MDAEIAVFQALRSLCAGRVYPDHLPADVAYPCIRYSQVGGQADSDNCGTTLTPRIQLDVYADTAQARQQLSGAAQAAMAAMLAGEAVLQAAPIHSFDFEVKRYRATLDYLIF